MKLFQKFTLYIIHDFESELRAHQTYGITDNAGYVGGA